ncbi:MAG: hypothetical protein ACHQVS_04200 [Candidatus Babeliales bacterium]
MNKLSIILMSLLTTAVISATMVEFVEDGYTVQAPKEITDLVAEAARIVDFDKPYEVVVPKKAGLQVNPWNRFISSAVNSVTNNWLVLVNPDWLSTFPHDQQIFLISRCFMQGNMGMIPPIAKYISWLFVIASWVVIYGIYRLLNRTRLSEQKTAVRIALAVGIVMMLNIAVVNKLQMKLLDYMYRKHDKAVNMAVIEKTGNREAAIQALQAYDAAIKKSIKEGEASLVPFEMIFDIMAQALKTS